MSDLLTMRARITVPPAVVYQALTAAEGLQIWFAEHAAVSLAGGRFAFWGRYTPQGTSDRQRLVAAVPDRLLRFAWELDGMETIAELQVEPDGPQGTVLTLTQSGMPTLDELMTEKGNRSGRHSLHTFWGLAIAILAEHVEGRELTPRCDFSDSSREEIFIEMILDAPPERVFASLIEPEQIDRWFGDHAEVEPRLGGQISFFGGDPATIIALEPGRALAYRDHSANDDAVVRWELAEASGKTRLSLADRNYAGDRSGSAAQHEAGWLGSLAELKRIHELGPAWQPLISESDPPQQDGDTR